MAKQQFTKEEIETLKDAMKMKIASVQRSMNASKIPEIKAIYSNIIREHEELIRNIHNKEIPL